MSETVSSSAIDSDAVHGQGLCSVDGEGLNRRVLDCKSITIVWLATGCYEVYSGVFLHGRRSQAVSVEELRLGLAYLV